MRIKQTIGNTGGRTQSDIMGYTTTYPLPDSLVKKGAAEEESGGEQVHRISDSVGE